MWKIGASAYHRFEAAHRRTSLSWLCEQLAAEVRQGRIRLAEGLAEDFPARLEHLLDSAARIGFDKRACLPYFRMMVDAESPVADADMGALFRAVLEDPALPPESRLDAVALLLPSRLRARFFP